LAGLPNLLLFEEKIATLGKVVLEGSKILLQSFRGAVRIFFHRMGANPDLLVEPVAHGVNDREKDLGCVDGLENFLGSGQEMFAKVWVRQQGSGEPAGRPPPGCAGAKSSRRRAVLGPSWRHVTRHSERQRHVVKNFVLLDAIVKTPRLVLIPGVHLPFSAAADVVVGEVVVEEAVPMR